jgi:magnesium transporter
MKRVTHATETSLARANPHLLVAAPDESAGTMRERLRRHPRRDWDLLCVIDAEGRLLGTLRPQELATLHDEVRLEQAMHRGGPTVSPGADQEHMASHALQHSVAAMPVVDGDGKLVGVVGPHELMDVLRHEHVEDLHRMAGINRETHRAREAIEAAPMRRARHRLPWLLLGLLGSALATYVVSRFESLLAARPALAFFVPALVYLADAIGTQSEAVAVRGLSLTKSGLARLAGGEVRTGLLIGTVLAGLALPMIWLAFGDLRLAAAVSGALACASIVASLLGLLIPWLLHRSGVDPAYGAGPLATILQDVLSLLIYFAFVSAFLAQAA